MVLRMLYRVRHRWFASPSFRVNVIGFTALVGILSAIVLFFVVVVGPDLRERDQRRLEAQAAEVVRQQQFVLDCLRKGYTPTDCEVLLKHNIVPSPK